MNSSLKCRSLFGLVPLSPQPFLFGPFNCFGLMGGLQPGREEGKRKIADGRTGRRMAAEAKERAERYRERGGRTVNLHKFDILGESGRSSMRNSGRVLSPSMALSLLNVFSSKMSIPSSEMFYPCG